MLSKEQIEAHRLYLRRAMERLGRKSEPFNEALCDMALKALSAPPEGTECKGTLWARVTAFRALKDNWNSYGAKAFPEATIQRAIKVACWLGDEWKCVPCADGPSVWFYLGDEEEIIEVRTSYEDPSAPQGRSDK